MMNRQCIQRAIASVVFATMALGTATSTLDAQRHKGSTRNLAVDVVRMEDGSILYGILLEQTADQLRLMCERKWLESNEPELLQAAVEAASQRTTANARPGGTACAKPRAPRSSKPTRSPR